MVMQLAQFYALNGDRDREIKCLKLAKRIADATGLPFDLEIPDEES